jgi:hypothetical protein
MTEPFEPRAVLARPLNVAAPSAIRNRKTDLRSRGGATRDGQLQIGRDLIRMGEDTEQRFRPDGLASVGVLVCRITVRYLTFQKPVHP